MRNSLAWSGKGWWRWGAVRRRIFLTKKKRASLTGSAAHQWAGHIGEGWVASLYGGNTQQRKSVHYVLMAVDAVIRADGSSARTGLQGESEAAPDMRTGFLSEGQIETTRDMIRHTGTRQTARGNTCWFVKGYGSAPKWVNVQDAPSMSARG